MSEPIQAIVAAGGADDGDSLWLLTFLNLLLVILSVFIMIYSVQQTDARRVKEPPSLTKEEKLLREQRARALALKKRLDELLRDSKLTGTVVDLHQGQPRIVLASGVVFDTGKAELTPVARSKLRQVAEVLKPLKNQLMIEGHTDDRPIRTSRFPSNWDLSTARALAVVRLMVDVGIPPERLKFVGFGEHQPRRPNDTEENRRLNRRIEIRLR